MEKKPKVEVCIKGLCKAIEDFCNSANCPSVKSLDDVEGILMIFFRKSGKARIHLIGEASPENIAKAFAASIHEMMKQDEGELPKYAA